MGTRMRKMRMALYRRVLILPEWAKAVLVMALLIPAVWMIVGMAILAITPE